MAWMYNMYIIMSHYHTYYQQQLPKKTLDDFRAFTSTNYHVHGQALEFTAHHLWLGYLCCCGQFDDVLAILHTASEWERSRYLSERSNEFWSGNLLHMVLYWNTDERAFEMYRSLRELGADLIENEYQHYPWENNTEIWTAPTCRSVIGRRDPTEFRELYDRIEQYEMTVLDV